MRTKLDSFTKTVSPGHTEYGRLFVTIEYSDGRLSVTGVEGPKHNGNARGSCGQCVDALDRLKDYAPGWDASLAAQLRETWNAWHLNNMRSGCEHQRAAGWGKETITLFYYKLNSATASAQYALERAHSDSIKAGETVTPSDDAVRLLNLPYTVTNDGDAERGLCPTEYELEKTEQKLSTWVYEKEHPRGVLTKPCPECGYAFGSKWLREDVPDSALAFLVNLPDSAADLPGQWAN